MKEQLCKAFCDELQIRSVPAGLAVGTAFDSSMGEPIGFYITGPDEKGRYRIEDDGLTVWHLEAGGADLEISSRAEVFSNLLTEYGFLYDKSESTLVSKPLQESQVASVALKFVALLLRLQDLLFLVQERVTSTFRQEVMRRLAERFDTGVTISENAILSPKLADLPADVVLCAVDRPPVALFLGTSDQHVFEAIILDMAARHEAKVDCSVVALLEKEDSISKKVRQRAVNRLAALPYYMGDENAAIERVAREVLGSSVGVH